VKADKKIESKVKTTVRQSDSREVDKSKVSKSIVSKASTT